MGRQAFHLQTRSSSVGRFSSSSGVAMVAGVAVTVCSFLLSSNFTNGVCIEPSLSSDDSSSILSMESTVVFCKNSGDFAEQLQFHTKVWQVVLFRAKTKTSRQNPQNTMQQEICLEGDRKRKREDTTQTGTPALLELSKVSKRRKVASANQSVQERSRVENSSLLCLTKRAESAHEIRARTRQLNSSVASAFDKRTAPFSPFHKSIAEKIRDFQNEVPSRFKSRPDPPTPRKPLSATRPVEFHLSKTLKRSETSTISETQFKARKLNRTILSRATGIPRVAKKANTLVQEFHLGCARGQRRKSSSQIVKETKLKARELNCTLPVDQSCDESVRVDVGQANITQQEFSSSMIHGTQIVPSELLSSSLVIDERKGEELMQNDVIIPSVEHQEAYKYDADATHENDIVSHPVILRSDLRALQRKQFNVSSRNKVAQEKENTPPENTQKECNKINTATKLGSQITTLKAQPIRKFKKLVIQKSGKPPTIATSPKFLTKNRTR